MPRSRKSREELPSTSVSTPAPGGNSRGKPCAAPGWGKRRGSAGKAKERRKRKEEKVPGQTGASRARGGRAQRGAVVESASTGSGLPLSGGSGEVAPHEPDDTRLTPRPPTLWTTLIYLFIITEERGTPRVSPGTGHPNVGFFSISARICASRREARTKGRGERRKSVVAPWNARYSTSRRPDAAISRLKHTGKLLSDRPAAGRSLFAGKFQVHGSRASSSAMDRKSGILFSSLLHACLWKSYRRVFIREKCSAPGTQSFLFYCLISPPFCVRKLSARAEDR